MTDDKKYTYDELKQAVKAADRDARLEMKVDYIIEKLEDPETGCTSCRKRLDKLEDNLKEYKTMGGVLEKAGSIIWGIVGGILVLIIGYGILWYLGIK